VAVRPEAMTLRRLKALLDVTRVVRGEEDLTSVLSTIVRTVAEALEFRTVVLNLYRPAFDDFCVTTVHGSPEARDALLGSTYDWASWQALLVDEFRQDGAYLIPYGSFDWSRDVGDRYVPEISPADDPEAWHPEDELFVPFEDSQGGMLGIFSVGEPLSGKRPTADEIEVLVALAEHAAIAIEAAQQAERTARHRSGLEQLLDVSSSLTAAESTDAILGTVCRGIQTALGFQRVSLHLAEPQTKLLRSQAAAGWTPDDPVIAEPLSFDAVRRLFDPQFEIAGCFLVPSEEARLRVDASEVKYTSQNNGRGPHAWNHHWLAVPLYDRAGAVIGVIWADEPDDRLLPSAERLQALRVFANQATTALLAAQQFEQMRFLADHDPLTDLLNRRSFVRELESEVARARRYDHPLAVLVLDFDELKTLNDTHGHAAGDAALQHVAATLKRVVRSGDHAFRIGGDEFAVLLPESTAEDARAVARRIADELSGMASIGEWELSLSFGVSVHDGGADPAALLRSADDAMYEMKRKREALDVVDAADDADLDAVA
jgi:diguanylate cyclase (GGDEF)-like protein